MGNRLFYLILLFSTALDFISAQSCDHGLQKCDWEEWSKWSGCSKDCGEGTRTRSRGMCCKEEDSFEKCLRECGVPDESWQSEPCGNVCPSGNCTFEELTDTGIEATDYVTLMDGNVILNPPVTLRSSKEFCKQSCLETNLPGGLHCWTYTYTTICKLYFYYKPLEFVNTDKKGGSPGTSVYVRHCKETAECKATSADVIFVVDSSGSIGSENFKKIKAFVQSLVNGLDIDKNFTRVGLMTFNDHAKWEFKLDQYDTKLDILKAIGKIPYIIGSTQTAEALETLKNEGFTDQRTGVPKIAVVITDGLSRYPSLTKVRAALLRQMGVLMYAIGVGNSTDHTELFNMASIPEDRYLYEFPNYDDLNNVTLDVNLVKCKPKIDLTNSTNNRTTTAVPINNCTDTIDNCDAYGRDMCTDFGPWAHSHCSLYCGFCHGPTTPAGPCEDKLPNCASFGQYVCESKDYIAWVNTNCRRFCGICKASVTTLPTTQTTTTVKICADTIDNCAGYAYACKDPKFRGFLEARCPAYCGFCKSYEVIHGNTVNGVRCPDWKLPTECTLQTVSPDCCPLPHCPDGYTITAEKRPANSTDQS